MTFYFPVFPYAWFVDCLILLCHSKLNYNILNYENYLASIWPFPNSAHFISSGPFHKSVILRSWEFGCPYINLEDEHFNAWQTVKWKWIELNQPICPSLVRQGSTNMLRVLTEWESNSIPHCPSKALSVLLELIQPCIIRDTDLTFFSTNFKWVCTLKLYVLNK